MREIKFRAFDEGNKIMHYDFQFIKSGDEGNDWIIFTSDKNKLSNKTISFAESLLFTAIKNNAIHRVKRC